jgi:hypothetical protein
LEAGQRELVVLAFATLVAAAVPSGVSAQDGTASGHLTLNGETTPLTRAYASAQPGFFDKTREDIRILLSDVELPDSALEDVFELIHLGRDGKARIVEVVLDADAAPISGAIYAKAFDGSVSVTGMHRFARQVVEHGLVAGRLSMDEPKSFQGVTFQYDATFSARIPRAPTAEEVAAAIASPPGVAAARCVDALRSGNREAFLSTLSGGAAAAYSGPEGAKRFEALRTDTPADSHLVGLERPSDSTAHAIVNGTRDGIVIEFQIELALEGGTWLVVNVAE